MKRPTRDVRFHTLFTFYSLHKGKTFSDDNEESLKISANNIKQSSCIMYQSELEKFAERYPQVNIDDFTEFLTTTGGLKTGAKKTGGSDRKRLNTPEAARERGVTEENIKAYLQYTDILYKAKKELDNLMTNAKVSLAMPIKKTPADTEESSSD